MALDIGTLINVGFFISFAIVYAFLAIGFNVQWGYTGLFNAGIAGFMLIGAYVVAIATTAPAPPVYVGDIKLYPGHLGGYSLPLAVGFVLAMVISGAIAALLALPTLRLRADYLAIATLAFAEIVRSITINLESVTAGTIGIVGIPPVVPFNPPNAFLTTMTIVGIGAVILLALLVVLQFIVESPWGRVLRAVREDEEATMALGKNAFGYKLQAFALGGAFMGLAGALFAVTFLSVEPLTSFTPAVTFYVWLMVIVGGSGNNRGAVIGAFLIYGMEWLSLQLKDFAPPLITAGLPAFILFLVIVGVVALIVGGSLLLLAISEASSLPRRIVMRIRRDAWLRGATIGAIALYCVGWLFALLGIYKPGAIGDTIFYIRFMVIGVLLIVLIIYRPEGVLRERKRVLK